jgi:hypothetical protein
MVVHAHNSTGGRHKRIEKLEVSSSKIRETLSQKQNTNEGAGGMAQVVVACLAKKEALDLMSSTTNLTPPPKKNPKHQ